MRSRSGLCTRSAKSRTVRGSAMSRRCATSDMTRWFCTSQATVSVSPSLMPRRGQRLAGNGGTGIRMILVAAFGDVVQEDRHIERIAAFELAHQLMRQRIFLAILALLDFRQDADGAQEMLVRRVVVIHVELHQRDDAAEILHEAAKHACLVHQAERRFRRLFRGEDFEEEAVCLLALPERCIDKAERARDELQHIGVNIEAVNLRHMEEADDIDRVLREEIVVRDGQAVCLDAEAANDLLAADRLHEAAD